MSRLRRLKEEKRKNRIKATSCGLALALMLGSTPYLGTYALFTDIEDASGKLSISTGDIDVEVDDKQINKIDLEIDKPIKHNFQIVNDGTLNQNIQLKFNLISTDMNEDLLDFIDYKLTMTYNGNNILTIDDDLEDILYDDDDVYKFNQIIPPDGVIDCNLEISIDKDEIKEHQLDQLSEKKVKFQLQVIACQNGCKNGIHENHNGFYDISTQVNTISIAKQMQANLTAHFRDENRGIRLNIKGILGGRKLYKVQEDKGKSTGQFKNAYVVANGTEQGTTAIRNFPIKKFNIGDNFRDSDKLVLYVTTQDEKGNKVIEEWDVRFRMKNNQDLEANYEVVSSRLVKEELEGQIEPDVLEPPKEEAEKPSVPDIGPPETTHPGVRPTPPSEPDVEGPPGSVNPGTKPTEPSRPGVTEPPSEPDVEGPPGIGNPGTKPTVPSKPGTIEPPSEETEIPDEPEVVEPPKDEEVEIPSEPKVVESLKNNETTQE